MTLHEIVTSLHMHTPYSDGQFSHAQIADAAIRAGIDCVYVTDHNVWVKGPEHYYNQKDRKVLVLVGEEVHDAGRQPQQNHLLVFGTSAELAQYATDPQALIDAARRAGALTFIAHPFESAAALVDEPAISWTRWEVSGFTGMEIWNYMSEFKDLLTSRTNMLRYALNPEIGIAGPKAEILSKWDELTASGRKVVAIGGVDAHGTTYHMGALQRVVFPYEFLFRHLATHLLTEAPLTGVYETDRPLVLAALAQGHCFVGYDGAAPTRGFRFTVHTDSGAFLMGDEVSNRSGVTMQIAVPTQPGQPPHPSGPAKGAATPAGVRVSILLIRNGIEAAHWENQTNLTHVVPARETGVYRVEVRLRFQGRLRGWIFSNPVYLGA
jgi:hypothetical protein